MTATTGAADKKVDPQLTEDPVNAKGAPEKGKKGKKGSKDAKEDRPPRVPYFKLYRFASKLDLLLIFIATICAIALGCSLPLMTIFFGNLTEGLTTYNPFIPGSKQKLQDTINDNVLYLTILGVGAMIVAYFQNALWMWSGENQVKRIKELYLLSIIRQDIGWFDAQSTGELTNRMVSDTALIQEGISEKVGLVIQFMCTFLAGFIIGFVKGPKLAGVLCCVFPLLGLAGYFMSKFLADKTEKGQGNYGKAGAIADQVFSAMRTVVAFGGQKRETDRYTAQLDEACTVGIRKGLGTGLGFGVTFMLVFLAYGSTLVEKKEMTGGEVLNVLFAIIIGAFSVGNAGPSMASIGTAQGAAVKIFETIDRASPIDSLAKEGKTKDKVEGRIHITNCNFRYPSRADVPVLEDFTLHIEPGQTIGLVGLSGSGKSTIVKLLERFYDPISGDILLDGEDIKSYNVAWLRQQIGIVSQEPVLFNTSIKQNLLYGLPDDRIAKLSDAQIDELVKDSLVKANAWDFVSRLSDGVNTNVGDAGGLMSGGQKQRIAIARALMKNPKILLLDEATSALDTESERVVQAALNRAQEGRTTIVIAHRLSTIKSANLIVVMSKGKIMEKGSHEALIAAKGIYADLVTLQQIRGGKEDEEDDITADKIAAADRPDTRETVKDKAVVKPLDDDEEDEETKKKMELEKLKTAEFSWGRLFKLNAPEFWIILLGITAAAVNGVINPLFALFFSEILSVFGKPDTAEMRKAADFWSLMFLVLGLTVLLANFTQISSFTASGERLTRRLRFMAFASIMRQEMGFFDQNSVGVLTGRLAEDATLVQGLTGQLLGLIIQNIVNMVAGLTIAFVYGWELTLVVLATIPVIAISGYLQLKSLSGFGEKTKKAYRESGKIASEVIENIRTVAPMTKEQYFLDQYHENVRIPHSFALKGAFVSSFGFGVSQGSMFLVFALAFWYGMRLMLDGKSEAKDVLIVMFSVIFTAMAAGQFSSFAPNTAKAKLAAISIFELVDRNPLIVSKTEPSADQPKDVKGEAQVDNAHFNYPSRPELKILDGLSVEAKPNKTLALVGPSGSGKSTIIQLLERFYDVAEGSVKIEGFDVKDWVLEEMRMNMALVSQEPTLFDYSILENIKYGKETATREEIEAAARLANIHDFVMSLPEGYQTRVGEKGSQMSGGQKQRIAIARALVRNPKILLLDEATSALDSESEVVVQEALNKAAANRTTVVIAHRLSTIVNADCIVVMKMGKVIQVGTHDELLKDTKGVYYELAHQQHL